MKDLTSGNIYKNFILFGLPSVLTTVLTLAQQTINTAVAGKYLSEEGLAAVGAMSGTIQLVNSAIWGAGVGFAVYIAKVFGSKDYKKLKNDIISGAICYVGMCLFLGVMILILRGPLYSLMQVDPSILKDTNSYFTFWACTLFVTHLSGYLSFVMHATGSSSYPFAVSLVSTGLNIGVAVVCITKLNMGVMGLNIASLVSCSVNVIFYTVNLVINFKKLGVGKGFKFNKNIIKVSWRYFLPNSLQQTSMYLAGMVLSPYINGISASATAGYNVVNKIYSINANIYQASAKTVSNYCAQSVGAKKYDKIHKGIFVGLLQGIMFLSIPLFVTVFFPKEISLIFFPDGFEGESLNLAVLFCRYYMPFVLFNLINNLFHAFLRGIADMKSLFISSFLGAMANLGLSCLFAYGFNMGMKGVFLGWAMSWIIEAVYIFIVFLIKYRTKEMIINVLTKREKILSGE